MHGDVPFFCLFVLVFNLEKHQSAGRTCCPIVEVEVWYTTMPCRWRCQVYTKRSYISAILHDDVSHSFIVLKFTALRT